MKELPLNHKAFFFLIYGLAILLFITSVVQGNIIVSVQSYSTLVFFILITALTESITLCFNGLSFSTTFGITVATYLLLGPFESMIILQVGFLIRVLKIGEDKYKHVFNTPVYGTMFNCSMFASGLLISNYIYIKVGGTTGEIYPNIIPIIIFSMIYIIINNIIVAALIAIRTGKSVLYCFIDNVRLTILSYVVMIPIGLGLAIAFQNYSYWGVIVPLFPILLVKYTFTYYAEANSQYIQTVETLMNAMEARDKYTQGHSHRVAEIACILAKKLGYNQFKIERLRIAAMLHDVGKIGISDNILNKPGKLTGEEFDIIKSHPTIGAGIIKDIRKLQYTIPIVKHHHERYDGNGYPDGKGGSELDLDVYIIQLADTIDAMASDRPYRKGLPKEVIIEEVDKYAGTQFHPKVAKAYLEIARHTTDLEKIWG